MKLLTRYNRLNITATIFIFLIGSFSFYFLLRYILINELDETLRTEQQEINAYVKEHHTLPEILPTKEQHISYHIVPAMLPEKFYNVTGVDDREPASFREIQFSVQANGNIYSISVSKPLQQTQNLLRVIIGVTMCMIGLILAAAYLINNRMLNNLWKPFYHTIEQVRSYRLTEKKMPELSGTDIDEFALLNDSIMSMTSRIQGDYQSLKEFTSHAAHEMQTPLSVIRTKLDMLMQNEALLMEAPAQIAEIEKAVHKLSRLYKSLLLLTKVENRQFEMNDDFLVSDVIIDKFTELLEAIEAKNIHAIINVQPFTVVFHRQLMEITIANLLHNAVRYTEAGGSIHIELVNGVMRISNSAASGALDMQRVFQRFYRGAHVKEDGNGLGLSIVKQICDMGGFSVRYDFEDGHHVFSIVFSNCI